MSPPETGVAAMSVTCDVTAHPRSRAAITEVADTLGGIDIVVNNAGIGATATSRRTRTTSGTGCST